MSRRVVCLAIVAGLAVAACSDDSPSAPEASEGPPGASAAAVGGSGLPVYGLGGFTRAHPASPCHDAMHRQFDFWLGEWNVFNPAGDQVGTNVVESELDGCVVAENWVSAAGIPGRSINTFDSETGQWHQTWVSARRTGHLRMAGGLDDQGRMVLEGRREAQAGFDLFDEFRWTVLGPDEVVQVGTLTVPAADVELSFTGIYRRADDVTPAPETPTAQCQPGGDADVIRELDFWLGAWDVEAENGRSLGTSRVTTDLSGCLVEERFETSAGYRAVSFVHWDFWEETWYRTYIDSEGERVEMSGALDGPALVLTAMEAGPGHSGEDLLVRVRLDPVSSDVVRQVWETSRDEGERWKEDLTLVYRRTEPAPSASFQSAASASVTSGSTRARLDASDARFHVRIP